MRHQIWRNLILLVAAGWIAQGCTAALVGAAAEESAARKTGKECAFANLLQRKAFCADPAPKPEPERYCYRDIAGVTCYAVPSGNNTTASRYVAPYPEVQDAPGQVQNQQIQGNPLDRQIQEAEANNGPQVLFPPRVQNKDIHTLNPPPQ